MSVSNILMIKKPNNLKLSPSHTRAIYVLKLLLEAGISFCRVGRETLMNESLADDDIEIELAPIAVQLAYVQKVP